MAEPVTTDPATAANTPSAVSTESVAITPTSTTTVTEVAAPHPAPEEPTLAALLRAFAHDQVPSRFYLFLQLGLPWAVQFWIWGWPRTSALLFALSMFGIWALSEQAIMDRDATTKAQSASSAESAKSAKSAESAESAKSQSPQLPVPALSNPSASTRSAPALLRVCRRLSGFLAGAIAFGLLFETFVRALFAVIRCPGCAS